MFCSWIMIILASGLLVFVSQSHVLQGTIHAMRRIGIRTEEGESERGERQSEREEGQGQRSGN